MNLWDEIDQSLHLFARTVLTFTDIDGYPFSVRTYARQDRRENVFRITMPEGVPAASGPAWLLWHTHDDNLDVQHTLAVRGELVDEDGCWLVRPERVMSQKHGPEDADRASDRYLRDRGLAVPDDFPWADLEPLARQVKQRLGRD